MAYYMICIAVVDDEKAVCDELLFFLKEYEMKFKMIFDISIYYNGENLLADLEDDIHFDLILLDIELAKINGVEVGRHIREINQYGIGGIVSFTTTPLKIAMHMGGIISGASISLFDETHTKRNIIFLPG